MLFEFEFESNSSEHISEQYLMFCRLYYQTYCSRYNKTNTNTII